MGHILFGRKDPIKEYVKQALAVSGRSQTDLARHLGIDPSAVNRIIRGHRKLSTEEATKAADFLGIALTPPKRALPILGYLEHLKDATVSYSRKETAHVEADFLPSQGKIGIIFRNEEINNGLYHNELSIYGSYSSKNSYIYGAEYVVKLKKIGDIFVGRLFRGSNKGVFTLKRPGFYDIRDVEIDWARPFILRLAHNYWRVIEKDT